MEHNFDRTFWECVDQNRSDECIKIMKENRDNPLEFWISIVDTYIPKERMDISVPLRAAYEVRRKADVEKFYWLSLEKEVDCTDYSKFWMKYKKEVVGENYFAPKKYLV